MVILFCMIDHAQDRYVGVRVVILEAILMVGMQKSSVLRQICAAVITPVTALFLDSVCDNPELGTVLVQRRAVSVMPRFMDYYILWIDLKKSR